MNYDDLKTKSQDELKKTLLDLKKEQMELRFKHAGGQLDKVDGLRKVRKNIARVQTAMTAPAQEAKAKPAAKKTETKKTTKKSEKAA